MKHHACKWSKAEIRVLRRFYPNQLTAAVARYLGRTDEGVRKQAQRLGIKKSRKYLKSIGR